MADPWKPKNIDITSVEGDADSALTNHRGELR